MQNAILNWYDYNVYGQHDNLKIRPTKKTKSGQEPLKCEIIYNTNRLQR